MRCSGSAFMSYSCVQVRMRLPSGLANRARAATRRPRRRSCRPRPGRSRCRPGRSRRRLAVGPSRRPWPERMRTPASRSVGAHVLGLLTGEREQALVHGGEVDGDLGLERLAVPPSRRTAPRDRSPRRSRRGVRRGDEALRRHDIGHDGGPADAHALDQGHLGSELGGRERRLVAAGTAAEDGDALSAFELRVVIGIHSCAPDMDQSADSCVTGTAAHDPSTGTSRVCGRWPPFLEWIHAEHTQQPPRRPRLRTRSRSQPQAAADIARLTGVEKHDIALTLGSGWGKAAEIIGETVATIPATEVTGFRSPRWRATSAPCAASAPPAASTSSSSARAPTTTRATACAASSTACAPPPRRARRSWCSPTAPAASARPGRPASRC